MAEFQEGNFVTLPNTVDLTGKQYFVVSEDANGNAVLAGAADANMVGVLNNAPKANWGADVAVINGNGTFKVIAAGNIAKNAKLTSDANGKATTATSGQRVFGIARRAAVAGDIVEYYRYNGVA